MAQASEDYENNAAIETGHAENLNKLLYEDATTSSLVTSKKQAIGSDVANHLMPRLKLEIHQGSLIKRPRM